MLAAILLVRLSWFFADFSKSIFLVVICAGRLLHALQCDLGLQFYAFPFSCFCLSYILFSLFLHLILFSWFSTVFFSGSFLLPWSVCFEFLWSHYTLMMFYINSDLPPEFPGVISKHSEIYKKNKKFKIFHKNIQSFTKRLFKVSKIIENILNDYWKGGRGQMKKLPPFWYRHFHPPRVILASDPHFFCLNHLYMDPIWKINRSVFESSKCVFDVYSLIVCWLSADNHDYPDNRRLSLINSEVFSWGGLEGGGAMWYEMGESGSKPKKMVAILWRTAGRLT